VTKFAWFNNGAEIIHWANGPELKAYEKAERELVRDANATIGELVEARAAFLTPILKRNLPKDAKVELVLDARQIAEAFHEFYTNALTVPGQDGRPLG